MNTVQARVWRFWMRGQQVEARKVGQGNLPVGLARLVHVNAAACDLSGVVDYRIKQLEARLLVSYLDAPRAGAALSLDYRRFEASSRHIRGFVSECSGLGMLTAAGEGLFSWRDGEHPLHSFDALPRPLAQHYPATGVRPDLLFHLPGGPVAGEARGRHRRAKRVLPVRPLAEQKARLGELASWSAAHSDHMYFMSWVWIGASGVAVDIFLPESASRSTEMRVDWMANTEPMKWSFRIPSERPEPRARHRAARSVAPTGQDVPGITEPLRMEAEPRRSPAEQAEEAADRLYESAPEQLPDLSGISVRGGWVAADVLGPARFEVLLGVLADRPPRQPDVRARLARSEGRFDVCLDGRLLTVVRPVRAPEFEWAQLERVLLSR